LLAKSYLCSQQYYFPEILNYMRMKKFTLMIIAALMAVTANAQKLERAQLARPMQNRVSMTASPIQSKVNSVTRPMQGKTQSVETIKQLKKTRKAAAVSSIDDLTGKWMQIYYSSAEEAILSTVMEISQIIGSENGITISGWWNMYAEPIEAKVDLKTGTITVDPQQVYGSPSLTLVNASSENDGAALVGTIEEDGSITFEDAWAVMTGTDTYEYGLYTMLVRPNGKMDYTIEEETYSDDIYIEEEEDGMVYIYNFANFGRMIELELNPDKTIRVPSEQVVLTYQGNDYILYGVEMPYVTSLGGIGTETMLTFDKPWTGFAENGDNLGLNSDCIIYYTDGTTFEYPVEPEDVAATPATPTDLEYEETQYGPAILFDVPREDVDGKKLRKDKLFYQIYYMFGGKEYVYTLQASDYKYLKSDMDVIPYSFTDDYDIFTDGDTKTVYLYGTDGWEKVGVKSIYKGGGKTHESEIVWYDIVDTGISQVNAAQQNGGKAFNLAGQQVKQGYKGIVIKDGKKFMVK